MNSKGLKNIIYIGSGFICIGLGCIGIVLPVLPTTPFLLLALLCFSKGSNRFYHWFSSTGLYKKYLSDFIKTRSMKLKAKISILIMASLVLIVVFVVSPLIWIKALILWLMGIKYYYFIFKIKTIKSANSSPSLSSKKKLSPKNSLQS